MNRKVLQHLPESPTDTDTSSSVISNHSRLWKVKNVSSCEHQLSIRPPVSPGRRDGVQPWSTVPGGVGGGDGRGLAPPAPGSLCPHLKTNSDKLRMSRNSRDIAAFREYLELTGKLTIDLTLFDMEKRETVILHLPYTHRCEIP